MDKQDALTWPGWERGNLIGSGSFGDVYEIRRTDGYGVTQTAALKIITIPSSQREVTKYMEEENADEAGARIHFKSCVSEVMSEIRLMSQLKGNSNIVSYEDHVVIEQEGEIRWDILIRMELLTPLPRFVKGEAPLKEREIIQLGIDICRALEVCAQKKIVHRDIKPENIFVSQYGTFKLGDFGIAKSIEKTRGGTIAGTMKYMAPEVKFAQPYNASVDIYSLGLVLYWLLNAHRLPFWPMPPVVATAEQAASALERRLRGESISPPRNGSTELKKAVLKACAFHPKDRYATATEFRESLEEICRGSANIPAWEGETVKIPVRHRRRFGKWLAILGILVGLGIGVLTQNNSRDAAVPNAVAESTAPAPNAVEDKEKLPVIVAAGADYTLWTTEDGQVLSEGRNDCYQSSVSSWKEIVDMDAGWLHSVGLGRDGRVVACGANSAGQCETAQWQEIVDVAAGWLHTAAVCADGRVVAIGDNQYGQCDVSSWQEIVAVSAGFTHTVGLKADGTVVSVGENTDGECDVSELRDIKAIAAGADHTVGLRRDGTVIAVGANDYGECEVSQWRNIVAVAAASTYTLGLQTDGTVVVAGTSLPEGFDVTGWRNVTAIAAGQNHAVGICADGTTVCTGRNLADEGMKAQKG